MSIVSERYGSTASAMRRLTPEMRYIPAVLIKVHKLIASVKPRQLVYAR